MKITMQLDEKDQEIITAALNYGDWGPLYQADVESLKERIAVARKMQEGDQP